MDSMSVACWGDGMAEKSVEQMVYTQVDSTVLKWVDLMVA